MGHAEHIIQTESNGSTALASSSSRTDIPMRCRPATNLRNASRQARRLVSSMGGTDYGSLLKRPGEAPIQ